MTRSVSVFRNIVRLSQRRAAAPTGHGRSHRLRSEDAAIAERAAILADFESDGARDLTEDQAEWLGLVEQELVTLS